METIFLNTAGTVLFVRDDMEEGHWTQEEYTVNATFPFVNDKVILRGMRMAFRDPATGTLEVFEIRNITNIEPDHYQQIIAEHIAVSELTDEHTDENEITDSTAAEALASVLTGTLWSVGNSSVSNESSADIARGSVWQAVIAISSNWNCYIMPRVTTDAAGSITGRYLDISPAQGTWRGVRLSVDKNICDSSVVYDDSEVLTALYGYGGLVDVTNTGEDDTQETLTFEDEVWASTSDHPAKPLGQKYIEWPEKTALYGRNGRPRYGYYQNADITDAETLLQKTWETLKTTCDPKISITGTVEDLYRLGYADQPLRLHDTVIVEIRQTGEHFQKEIIQLDVDLIDPTGSRPTIGSYVPNIIYINRETESYATTNEPSSRGGGGGGRGGGSNKQYEDSETWSGFEKTNNMIAMVVGTRNGDNYIKAGEIGLAINKSGETGSYESTAYINANHVNISATDTNYSLAGELERDADGKLIIKSAGGMYVKKTEGGVTSLFGVWDADNLTGGIMAEKINGQTQTLIKGDVVNISGTSTVQSLAGAMELDANGNLIIKNGAGFKLEKTSGGSTAQYGVWDQGNLTAGVIATIVNGVSSTYISGDKIYIGNQDATTVINGKLNASDVTAKYIQGKITDITILSANALSVAGGINGSGTLTVAGLTTLNGSLKFGSGNSFSNCIVSADITTIPGTLRLIDAAGNVTDFSKATSLSGSWSGTTYTVTASPQGNTNSTTIVLDLYGSANIIGTNVKNGNTVLDSKGAQLVESVSDKKVYCNLTGGSGSTIAQISTSDTYDAGVAEGEGNFTLATVIPQGDSQSVYIVPSSGGTNYYQAGSAVYVYDAGSAETVYSMGSAETYYKGDGGEVYPITSTTYFTHYGSGRHYDVNGNFLGNHDWYYSGSGTAYYKVGSKKYARGDEVTVNPATNGRTIYPAKNGRSITPISGSALTLLATTRYKAGTPVTDTYYVKN